MGYWCEVVFFGFFWVFFGGGGVEGFVRGGGGRVSRRSGGRAPGQAKLGQGVLVPVVVDAGR